MKATRSPFNINPSPSTIDRTFCATVDIVCADRDSRKEDNSASKRSLFYRYGKLVPSSAFLVCEFGIQNLKVGQAKWARLCLLIRAVCLANIDRWRRSWQS
jgi:hypothetical protein